MKYKDDVKEVDAFIEENIRSVKVEYNFSIRYYLKIIFNKSDNVKDNVKMVIIMMNPSNATDEESDQTVSEVLEFAKPKYKEVIIFNVLPFYGTNSDNLAPLFKEGSEKENLEQLLKNNIKIINKKLSKEKDTEIFLATGCPKDGEVKKVFLRQLQKIYGLLKKNNSGVRAFSITEDKKRFLNNEGTTYHPRYLKIKNAFTHKKIVEVVVKGEDGTFSLTKKGNTPK